MHSGVCMAESLHCSPEIITTLFVNWLYLQNKKLKKIENKQAKKKISSYVI